MKVKVTRPRAEPDELDDDVLDLEGRRKAAVLGNRLGALLRITGKDGAPKRTPLSEFWTFAPVCCYSCGRKRGIDKLCVSWDSIIRCLDPDECRAYRYPTKPEPVKEPAKKRKAPQPEAATPVARRIKRKHKG